MIICIIKGIRNRRKINIRDEKEHFLSCEIGDEMAEQDFNEYRSRT